MMRCCLMYELRSEWRVVTDVPRLVCMKHLHNIFYFIGWQKLSVHVCLCLCIRNGFNVKEMETMVISYIHPAFVRKVHFEGFIWITRGQQAHCSARQTSDSHPSLMPMNPVQHPCVPVGVKWKKFRVEMRAASSSGVLLQQPCSPGHDIHFTSTVCCHQVVLKASVEEYI